VNHDDAAQFKIIAYSAVGQDRGTMADIWQAAISGLKKIRHNHEVAKLSMLVLNMILEHGFALETKPGKKTNGGMLVNRHLHDDFE
jgi:hypothetical protein